MTKRWRPRVTRRRFLAAAGGTLAAVIGVGGYAHWVEPFAVEFVHRDLPVRNLPAALAGRTLAHLSDLHVGTTDPEYLAAALRATAALRPDLVAITGDLMTCEGPEQVDAAVEALAPLRPPLGCYAVLGNHDYAKGWQRPDVADALAARLTAAGVIVLRNQWRDVAGLAIAGVDELWAGRSDPAAAVRGLPADRPAIALCHNPDAVDEPGWDGFEGWVLAGHTHGGQCKPPLLAPPVTNLRNDRYVAGEVDLGGGRFLYVSRGLGHVQQVRFNVPPEITLFRLASA